MKKTFLTLALLCSVSPAAIAQTVGGGGASIALPEIVVNADAPFNPDAGKYNGAIGETSGVTGDRKPILDIPRSVYVVTPHTLEQQMPQSLAEALQSVPGTFIGNTNGGNSDYVTIKGFEADANDFNIIGNGNGILIDGIRAPFDRVFNANTQSVELLSGPAALLYGNANVGGVIEVNRKLPLPEAHYAVDVLAGAVTGKVRDVAGSFDFTGPIYKSTEAVFAYRLVGSAARDEPWRIGDTTSRDFLLAPTFALYSDILTATIAFEHGKNQQPYDRGDTSLNNAPLNISRTESYSEDFSVFDENVNWVHSQVDYRPSKDTDFHLRSSYSYTEGYYNEVRSDNQTDFNPATGTIQRYILSNPGGDSTQQYYFSGSGAHRFDIGPIRNELMAGVDYYNFQQLEADENYNFYGANQAFNLYNPVYGTVPNGSGGVLDFAQLLNLNGAPLSQQKQRELGVFFQDTATYGAFTLIGGGRWTTIKSFEHYYGNTETNSTENAFLPSGQLLYAINKDTSLYASYSQAFQPNIYAIGAGTAISFVGPNEPTRGTGYEAGVKSKFLDGALLAQASAFLINKTDVQTQNQAGAISFQQSQRSEGVQLSVLGKITPNLEINASYSHQKVTITDDLAFNNDIGNQLINAPSDIFAVFAYYHFLDGPLNHLTLNAGVFGASQNPVNIENTFFLPSFAVTSVGFSYDYKRAPTDPLYRIAFKINNLFDSTYYPATGSKTNWITVGEPRNFLLDLSMSL